MSRLAAKRWTVAAAALAVTAAALAYPSVSRWLRSERSVELSMLRTATVSRGQLVRDVSVEGRIVAAHHPTLFSPAHGSVRLRVRAGELVEAGEALAEMESPRLESQLRQEESTLLSLQSELERTRIAAQQARLEGQREIALMEVQKEAARRALERARKAFAEGVLTVAEHEEAEDDFTVATVRWEHARGRAELDVERLDFEVRNRTAQVERQRLSVAELERQIDELTIRAPVGGLVTSWAIQDHDVVEAGDPLVGVVDLSAFEVEIQVPEAYADEVTVGTAAQIRYEGALFEGRVRRISPEVQGNRVAATVAFADESPAGLRQNQRVTSRLVFERRADVLKVPRGAFLESGGGRRIFVVRDGLATLREIEVGAVSVSEVEILAGLEEGETVILSDLSRFRDAETILVRK